MTQHSLLVLFNEYIRLQRRFGSRDAGWALREWERQRTNQGPLVQRRLQPRKKLLSVRHSVLITHFQSSNHRKVRMTLCSKLHWVTANEDKKEKKELWAKHPSKLNMFQYNCISSNTREVNIPDWDQISNNLLMIFQKTFSIVEFCDHNNGTKTCTAKKKRIPLRCKAGSDINHYHDFSAVVLKCFGTVWSTYELHRALTAWAGKQQDWLNLKETLSLWFE